MKRTILKIDMLTESYQEFETAFYKLYDLKPLYAIIDDLSHCISRNEQHYFKLPAKNSKDGREHRFYFKKSYCKVDRKEVLEFDYME